MEASISISDEMSNTARKKPLEVNRSHTNVRYIYFFGIAAITWLISCIIAFRMNFRKIVILYLNAVPLHGLLSSAAYLLIKGTGFLIWIIVLGSALLLTFILFLRAAPEFFARTGNILMYIVVIAVHCLGILSHLVLVVTLKEDIYTAALAILPSVIYLILYRALYVCVQAIGVGSVADAIGRSFRTLSVFRGLIVFVMLTIVTLIILLTITMEALYYTKFTSDFLFYSIFFGGMYLSAFVLSLQNMVISAVIATYHSTSNFQESPNHVILQCYLTIARNHIGSIALSATGIVPLAQAMYTLFTATFDNDKRHQQNSYVERVLRIYLAFNISNYADLCVAMYGCSYLEAVKKAYATLLKNYFQSTVQLVMFHQLILNLGVAISFFAVFLISFPIFGADEQSGFVYLIKLQTILYSVAFILLYPVIVLITSCYNTTVICELEDDKENELSNANEEVIFPAPLG